MTNRFTKGFYIVRFEYADGENEHGECCYTKMVHAESIEELHRVLDTCRDDFVDYWEASVEEKLMHIQYGDVL